MIIFMTRKCHFSLHTVGEPNRYMYLGGTKLGEILQKDQWDWSPRFQGLISIFNGHYFFPSFTLFKTLKPATAREWMALMKQIFNHTWTVATKKIQHGPMQQRWVSTLTSGKHSMFEWTLLLGSITNDLYFAICFNRVSYNRQRWEKWTHFVKTNIPVGKCFAVVIFFQ